MKTKMLVFFSLTMSYCIGQTLPSLRHADKVRIVEAVKIADKYGEQLFKGYSTAPFTILLVTDSIEFLMYHPNPSQDFKLVAYDTLLKSNVYHRKTQFSPHFLATFPAVNGLACIVVGTPENTNKNSTEWIITLLHEHFHQYQYSYPDYYQSVENLDLSDGDETGMWMLNYPFPYDNPKIIAQFESYSRAIADALLSQNKKAYKIGLSNYRAERNKFKELLSDKDYRYFSFQIWQEGLARNTEYEFLKLLKNYIPAKEVTELTDFIPFSKLAETMYKNEMKNLKKQKLHNDKRVSFYSIGFAEGLLLNKINPSWRKDYLTNKFYIEHYWNRNIQ